ncbi:MAG: radical SAM protein, partial [Nanoarchaeota archaeon]|nr:radical SAM protein [Nanoarchaeota archaeon]
NQCSYCAAKLARGNIYSFPQKDITNELKSAIEKGYNIFYLTSQDTAAYGLDHSPKSQLPHLLTCLTKLPGNFQLRVGMMNPSNTLPVLKQLIQAFNSPKIKPFLHIPVQSGSDKILKHMNRKYTTRDFKKIVTCFRKKIPGIDISTDIIVGYPTETRSDFRKTLSLIKTIKPEVLNISRYSKRPHTPASITHPKQHPTQELKHRSRQLTNLYRNYHSRQ